MIPSGSRGAKLIGGALRDEITREELLRVLLDGFFPLVERDAQLSRARGGLQEFGLPYAADPAVTRHLAVFLQRHEVPRIDAVLFIAPYVYGYLMLRGFGGMVFAPASGFAQ